MAPRNRRSLFGRILQSIIRCFCFFRKDNDIEIKHDTNDTKEETSELNTTSENQNVTLCINYTVNNIGNVNVQHFSGGVRKSKLGYRDGEETKRLKYDNSLYDTDDDDDHHHHHLYDDDDDDDFLALPRRYHGKQDTKAIGGSATKPGKDVADHGRRHHSMLNDTDVESSDRPTTAIAEGSNERDIYSLHPLEIRPIQNNSIQFESDTNERDTNDIFHSQEFKDILEQVKIIGTRNNEDDDANQTGAFVSIHKPIQYDVVQTGSVPSRTNDNFSLQPTIAKKGQFEENNGCSTGLIMTEEALFNICEDPSENITLWEKQTNGSTGPLCTIQYNTEKLSVEELIPYATGKSPVEEQIRYPVTSYSSNEEPKSDSHSNVDKLSYLYSGSSILYDNTANGIQKTEVVACLPSQQHHIIQTQHYVHNIQEEADHDDDDDRMEICENEEEITETIPEDSIENVPSLEVAPAPENFGSDPGFPEEPNFEKEPVKKANRQRSDVPYKERNRLAARKYRSRIKEVSKILRQVKSELNDTERQVEKKKKLIASGVPDFINKLIGGCENEDQAVVRIYDLILSHLSNVDNNRSIDLEGEKALFKDHIMPTLKENYLSIYERVMGMYCKEITTTVNKQKR